MSNSVLPIGNRIRVIAYGPFRGLQGTIQQVDVIADDPDDPFCFYLITLEGATTRAPIWFEWYEVEFIGLPSTMYHEPDQLTHARPSLS